MRQGAAWVYRQYSRDPALRVLEQAAWEERRGLWALPEAERVPPWECIGKLFDEGEFARLTEARQYQGVAWAQVSCRQMRKALVRARRYSPAVIRCRRGRK